MSLAARIAAKPRLAVAREPVNQMRLFKSPEALEGMRAFLSKTRT